MPVPSPARSRDASGSRFRRAIRAFVPAIGAAVALGLASVPSAAAAAPVAEFTSMPTAPHVGEQVIFNASASSCDSAPCAYTWEDRPPWGASWPLGTGQTLAFTFRFPGTKYVTLTVRDSEGAVDTVQHPVLISAAPAPLPDPSPALAVARFIHSPSSPSVGQRVAFDAGTSSCTAEPCSYTWIDVGPDGTGSWPLGTGQTMGFTFGVAGTKYVRLTVRDTEGRSASASSSVVVQAAPTPEPTPTPTPDPSPAGCDRSATTSTFASQLSAATAGQTICLASGNYGTFTGAYKPGTVTIREQAGASASMRPEFNGANNITIDGLTINGASLRGTTRNITIRNSTFTAHTTINDLANANVLLDNNTHNSIDSAGQFTSPARIHLSYGGSTHSGVTIQNSLLSGGSSDGVQTGVGVNIIGNEFRDIIEDGPNHTDSIQLLGAPGSVIRGNWLHNNSSGIVAYDGVTRATIENNVVDLPDRPWGIELYSDDGSIVRHNTLKHGACDYNLQCGMIDINRKSADDAGRGTIIVDNIATSVSVSNGSSVAERHHNLVGRNPLAGDLLGLPIFAGGMNPTTYAGFRLAAGSPGKNAASDGMDIGIAP